MTNSVFCFLSFFFFPFLSPAWRIPEAHLRRLWSGRHTQGVSVPATERRPARFRGLCASDERFVTFANFACLQARQTWLWMLLKLFGWCEKRFFPLHIYIFCKVFIQRPFSGPCGFPFSLICFFFYCLHTHFQIPSSRKTEQPNLKRTPEKTHLSVSEEKK